MNKITIGIIAGFVFGTIAVLTMIPIPFPDKRKKIEAMTGAFIERFMIGFLIPNVDLGMNYILSALLISIGLSAGTAVITRTYIPILLIGAIGGLLIGIISNMLLH